MERNKLHADTDLLELLEAAETGQDEPIIDDQVLSSDIPAFIIHHDLKAGDKIASVEILYGIYRNYSKSPSIKSVFVRQFSLYFINQNGYYLLNKDPSELIADLSLAIKKKKAPRIRQKATKLQFQSFLNHYNIDKGNDWIELHIVAHFYDKWAYETKKKLTISLNNLQALMRIFFENRKTKDGYVFKINHNFPKESIENLRTAWKRKKPKGRE